MEPKSSLQYSQQPATWHYRKPDQTSPHSTHPSRILLLEDPF